MTFTADQVSQIIAAAGVPAWPFQLADGVHASVSDASVLEIWNAWIDSLRLNAPDALTLLDLGGGKTRAVPRWVEEAGDCENHSLMFFGHEQTGNWLGAIRGGPRVGRAFGPIFFTSEPRAANRYRDGRHCLIWFIDADRKFRTFEPGDGDFLDLTATERASVTFGLAG